jgi:hypothetical protein
LILNFFSGQIDGKTVGKTHFGGFEDEDEASDDEGVCNSFKAIMLSYNTLFSPPGRSQRLK